MHVICSCQDSQHTQFLFSFLDAMSINMRLNDVIEAYIALQILGHNQEEAWSYKICASRFVHITSQEQQGGQVLFSGLSRLRQLCDMQEDAL
jgi:hypothetical protein